MAVRPGPLVARYLKCRADNLPTSLVDDEPVIATRSGQGDVVVHAAPTSRTSTCPDVRSYLAPRAFGPAMDQVNRDGGGARIQFCWHCHQSSSTISRLEAIVAALVEAHRKVTNFESTIRPLVNAAAIGSVRWDADAARRYRELRCELELPVMHPVEDSWVPADLAPWWDEQVRAWGAQLNDLLSYARSRRADRDDPVVMMAPRSVNPSGDRYQFPVEWNSPANMTAAIAPAVGVIVHGDVIAPVLTAPAHKAHLWPDNWVNLGPVLDGQDLRHLLAAVAAVAAVGTLTQDTVPALRRSLQIA